MSRLFNRYVEIDVNTIKIRPKPSGTASPQLLRAIFKIMLSLKSEPNSATLTIYNLNEQSRASFQKKGVPVTIIAGYEDNASQIFKGNLDFGENSLKVPDWITTFQGTDGGEQYRKARINTSFDGPVDVREVATSAAKSMGLDLGNLSEKVQAGSKRGLTEFATGLVMSGKSEKQLSKVLDSMGLTWSIQNGALQVLEPGETLSGKAILLSPETGLIGSPMAGDDGIVKAKALLQAELLPAKEVEIRSRSVNGFFKIVKSTFIGDTDGPDWFVEIEGLPL